MSPLLVALGIGILAYVIFVMAVPKAVPRESDGYLRDALDRLAEENRVAEQARTDVLRDQFNDAPPLIRAVFGLGFMRPIYEAGVAAGYQNDFQKLLVLLLLGFAVSLLGLFSLGLGMASLPGALALAYLVTLRHCKKRIRRRNHQFIDQFPDALDTIVRSVRAGFPISTALGMLVENAEDPIRAEFRQVTDEIALGRTLAQALARLATRVTEPDVRFFVVVLTVQQETGGNLAEIIGNLSNIIRKRKQIRHKIHAMTSEGRATGYVLGALPVLVFAALYFVQPGYLDPFFHDPLGQQFFGGAIALLVVCYFVIKQMIQVDI
ncbi:MAG: type II secretion system F family protein [Alphaproteobacteria bacterium]|nr:type II secretion system F family protein [Alphaproteobacteria bacterium]